MKTDIFDHIYPYEGLYFDEELYNPENRSSSGG